MDDENETTQVKYVTRDKDAPAVIMGMLVLIGMFLICVTTIVLFGVAGVENSNAAPTVQIETVDTPTEVTTETKDEDEDGE